MTGVALRQELHHFIDAMPERRLSALRPLLADLAGDNDYWKPVIEPASPEEIALIQAGVQEYHDHPENFISLTDYMNKSVN